MFTASLTSAPAVVHADLLVSSFDTNEIRRYDGTTEASLGNFVTVGSGGLDGPMGLAFGPDGHLYVSSSLTGAVLRYSGITGLSWTPSSPWEAAASQCPLGSSSTCSETAPSM
jgi:DNA-binding beta-propeller fold protein YncE